MGKIKSWAMEMERLTYEALDSDQFHNMEQINDYIRSRISGGLIDRNYIARIVNEYMAFESATQRHNSDIIGGYNRDDIGESPDY